MPVLTAADRLANDRHHAGALHTLWQQGQTPIGKKQRKLTMSLLSRLCLRHTGVHISTRDLGAILDQAEVWRAHIGAFTTTDYWLRPETGEALRQIATPPPAVQLPTTPLFQIPLPPNGH